MKYKNIVDEKICGLNHLRKLQVKSEWSCGLKSQFYPSNSGFTPARGKPEKTDRQNSVPGKSSRLARRSMKITN